MTLQRRHLAILFAVPEIEDIETFIEPFRGSIKSQYIWTSTRPVIADKWQSLVHGFRSRWTTTELYPFLPWNISSLLEVWASLPDLFSQAAILSRLRLLHSRGLDEDYLCATSKQATLLRQVCSTINASPESVVYHKLGALLSLHQFDVHANHHAFDAAPSFAEFADFDAWLEYEGRLSEFTCSCLSPYERGCFRVLALMKALDKQTLEQEVLLDRHPAIYDAASSLAGSILDTEVDSGDLSSLADLDEEQETRAETASLFETANSINWDIVTDYELATTDD